VPKAAMQVQKKRAMKVWQNAVPKAAMQVQKKRAMKVWQNVALKAAMQALKKPAMKVWQSAGDAVARFQAQADEATYLMRKNKANNLYVLNS